MVKPPDERRAATFKAHHVDAPQRPLAVQPLHEQAGDFGAKRGRLELASAFDDMPDRIEVRLPDPCRAPARSPEAHRQRRHRHDALRGARPQLVQRWRRRCDRDHFARVPHEQPPLQA